MNHNMLTQEHEMTDHETKQELIPFDIWITNMGEAVPIIELSDGHLLNIIRMLRRNPKALLNHQYTGHSYSSYTELATVAEEMLEFGELEEHPRYMALMDEARRRDIAKGNL